jgi:hypothetical protein
MVFSLKKYDAQQAGQCTYAVIASDGYTYGHFILYDILTLCFLCF